MTRCSTARPLPLPTFVLVLVEVVTLVIFGPVSTVVSAPSDRTPTTTGRLSGAVRFSADCRARAPPLEPVRDRRGESRWHCPSPLPVDCPNRLLQCHGLLAQLSPATTRPPRHPEPGPDAHVGSTSRDVPPNRGGEPMRRLNIAQPVQLRLVSLAAPDPTEVWDGLPEVTKGRVLALLARLVARGVVVSDHDEEIE